MPDDKYYAHSHSNRPVSEWHSLEEHLRETANLAALFAESFSSKEWAFIAGLWHDLGKYTKAFQKKIGNKHVSMGDPNGDSQHSIGGALLAADRDRKGRILAYIIAGHHAGLPDWSSAEGGAGNLNERLQNRVVLQEALKSNIPESILDAPLPSSTPSISKFSEIALWMRMLFSCLVDADFLNTEKFIDPQKTGLRGVYPDLKDLMPRLEAHLIKINEESEKTKINKLRQGIQEECGAKSSHSSSIFTLTVPTGGGKTLSSIYFAMKHALHHGKRRVVYVIPYTSIIEQTAQTFRDIFGDCVLEHHSNTDEELREADQTKLACENWDAPIIVTTNVQFFESFFASRTGRCRKLHNVADSVVVFDEVQLLPPDFLYPILDLIHQLHDNFGVTPVLCTATQPAFGSLDISNTTFEGLPDTVEIISSPEGLHSRFKRVTVHGLDKMSQARSWEEIADELKDHKSALCIVNTRKDALSLHRLMPKDTFHLSRTMCGEHLSATIQQIKDRLHGALPTRVISTQLIECGVDIDFPVVYRAMSGLDSIAQAAGRCNREGRHPDGKLHVFMPPSSSPPGHLRQMEDAARLVIKQCGKDPFELKSFHSYFQNLFWMKGDERLDKHQIRDLLCPGDDLNIDFRTAAEKFRLIRDNNMPVVTAYSKGKKIIEKLRAGVPDRSLIRKAQPYIVNISERDRNMLCQNHDLEKLDSGLCIQNSDIIYNETIGLSVVDPSSIDPAKLVS